MEQQVRGLMHAQGNFPRKDNAFPPPPPQVPSSSPSSPPSPSIISLPALRKRVEQRINQPRRSSEDQERANEVKKAFILAYSGYEKYCFGAGELKPISKTCIAQIPYFLASNETNKKRWQYVRTRHALYHD